MQVDAQLQPGGSAAVQSGDGAGGEPAAAEADSVDADMGEKPDERWLQQEKAAVPAGSEVHLMERMLFRSQKVTFGSMSNGAFEDALDMRTAITAERFRTWWSQEIKDTERYVWFARESLVQMALKMAASVRMIMALDGVDRMIIYRPATESEALTTVYEKDHIEKAVPRLEAVYLTSQPVKCAAVRKWQCG